MPNYYYTEEVPSLTGSDNRIVGKHYEVDCTPSCASGPITKRYYAGGRLLATRTGTTLRYIQPDHLGSSTTLTDANGVVVARERYSAFGERRRGETPATTDQLYTNQRYNFLSGLYHYSDGSGPGRFYDPLLGRFVKPDSITPGIGSQYLNRYSYVYNRPIKYIDPNGKHGCNVDDTSKCSSAGGGGDAGGSGGGPIPGNLPPTGVYNQVSAANRELTIQSFRNIGRQLIELGRDPSEEGLRVRKFNPKNLVSNPKYDFWSSDPAGVNVAITAKSIFAYLRREGFSKYMTVAVAYGTYKGETGYIVMMNGSASKSTLEAIDRYAEKNQIKIVYRGIAEADPSAPLDDTKSDHAERGLYRLLISEGQSGPIGVSHAMGPCDSSPSCRQYFAQHPSYEIYYDQTWVP